MSHWFHFTNARISTVRSRNYDNNSQQYGINLCHVVIYLNTICNVVLMLHELNHMYGFALQCMSVCLVATQPLCTCSCPSLHYTELLCYSVLLYWYLWVIWHCYMYMPFIALYNNYVFNVTNWSIQCWRCEAVYSHLHCIITYNYVALLVLETRLTGS